MAWRVPSSASWPVLHTGRLQEERLLVRTSVYPILHGLELRFLQPRGSTCMTIAACYLSSEGVVFGADSTSTMFVAGPGPAPGGSDHHYNFTQKIFSIGQDSALAVTLWGLGNLGSVSHRTLVALFA